MHALTMDQAALVSGGETSWPQAGVGLAGTLGPIAVAGGPAIVNGTVAGVSGPIAIQGLLLGAEGTGGMLVTAPAVAGGTVTGIALVPVALCVAVAVGGAVLGNAIGNSDTVQGWADSAGTWLGNHGIVW